MTVTLTHVYDTQSQAENVLQALKDAGFREDQISIVGRGNDGRSGQEAGDGAATGATLGGVAGAGAGLLASLGLIAIPGIGPLVAAGILATTLAGAATGAVTGGVLGALVEYGISEEDAHVYAESVRRGGTLVSIQVDEDKADQADAIMQRQNPVDIQERGRQYRGEGWTSYDPDAPIYKTSDRDAGLDRYS